MAKEEIQKVAIVTAVLAVHEAQKRIPPQFSDHTFFSKLDIWQFIAIVDDRTCEPCLMHDTLWYSGDELRRLFPYLEIVDANLIYVHVHLHCRCILNRIYEPSHYIAVTEKP